jgi:hypothetical protein
MNSASACTASAPVASPAPPAAAPSVPLWNSQLQPCVRLMLQDVLPFMEQGFSYVPTPLCDIIAEYAQHEEQASVAAALIKLNTRNGDCFELKTACCASEACQLAARSYQDYYYDSVDMYSAEAAIVFVGLPCKESAQWRKEHPMPVQGANADSAAAESAEAYQQRFRDADDIYGPPDTVFGRLRDSARATLLQLVADQPSLTFAPHALHAEIRRVCKQLPAWLHPRASLSESLVSWVEQMNNAQSTLAMAVVASWTPRDGRVTIEICQNERALQQPGEAEVWPQPTVTRFRQHQCAVRPLPPPSIPAAADAAAGPAPFIGQGGGFGTAPSSAAPTPWSFGGVGVTAPVANPCGFGANAFSFGDRASPSTVAPAGVSGAPAAGDFSFGAAHIPAHPGSLHADAMEADGFSASTPFGSFSAGQSSALGAVGQPSPRYGNLFSSEGIGAPPSHCGSCAPSAGSFGFGVLAPSSSAGSANPPPAPAHPPLQAPPQSLTMPQPPGTGIDPTVQLLLAAINQQNLITLAILAEAQAVSASAAASSFEALSQQRRAAAGPAPQFTGQSNSIEVHRWVIALERWFEVAQIEADDDS